LLGSPPIAGGLFEPLPADPGGPAAAERLARATLDRADVLDLVKLKVAPVPPAPSSQPAPATRPGGPAAPLADDEPPPQAVKYYLQGRERFLQGASSEAMDALENALQLDPDAFTVLRLMGRVCFAASQLARGSMYLERAQRLRPTDVEVNYLLGRYWLERKDADRAAYFLLLADGSPAAQQTSTQTPLSAFYLARALQAAGFHRAAARAFERFLDLAALPVPGYRYDRELGYLIDEAWAARLGAAENFAAAGDAAAAIPHYLKAAAAQPKDLYIHARLVYALARLRQFDAARATAFALLADTAGADDAVALLAWTYRATGREADLVPDLRRRIRPGADDPAAVTTLAAAEDYLGRPADAFRTLQAYLADHPANLDVLGRLLKRVDSADTFAAALRAAAAALAADPARHDAVLAAYLPVAQGPAGKAFVRNPPRAAGGGAAPAAADYAAHYLAAVARRLQDAPPEDVDRDFRAALAAAPAFAPARDAYIAWLLTREQFPRANELVQKAVADARGTDGEAKAWGLLVEAEAAQQRLVSAMKLAEEGKKKFPADADLRMKLAAVYRLRGQDAQADAELQALLTDQPAFEPAYKALITALQLRGVRRGGGGVGGAVDTEAVFGAIIAAVSKLTRALPESRYGQMQTALLFARSGRLEDAETLLRRLLADKPDDPEALVLTAQVRQARGRVTDALALLKDAAAAKPQPEVLRELVSLLTDQDKAADGLALTQKAAADHPDDPAFTVLHAQELESHDRQADAIAFLTDARKTLPRSEAVAVLLARLQADTDDAAAARTLEAFMRDNGESAERLYTLSHYLSAAGDDDGATSALQRALAIMPDHIGANNDLGYFWVDAGTHLDQAEGMIKKAVENEPTNAAFQDSLGWLYYKQGRFADAARVLDATIRMPGGSQPDVIQHLGDALYRAGKTAEAVTRWSQARDLLTRRQPASKADTKLKNYLDAVIAAARAGRRAAVTPVADLAAPAGGRGPQGQSAGPATAPAPADAQ
jgi:predicted Zn-dependent protease